MIMTRPTLLLAFCALRAAAAYYPLIEYSGTTFFDGFDFYGAIDNTTWGAWLACVFWAHLTKDWIESGLAGNVTYVDAADANAESLAYVNGAGNAIIKVDNSSTVLEAGIQYRKSVRL
jgi:hypothetical protein